MNTSERIRKLDFKMKMPFQIICIEYSLRDSLLKTEILDEHEQKHICK